MAKRRKKKTNPALPKWAVTVFAVIAVVLSIFTFGGDLIGIDTSFAQQAMDFIDRILYGGPTGPHHPRCRSAVRSRSISSMSVRVKASWSPPTKARCSSTPVKMTKATKCWNF